MQGMPPLRLDMPHAEHGLVKGAGARDVGHGQDQVVQALDLHASIRLFGKFGHDENAPSSAMSLNGRIGWRS